MDKLLQDKVIIVTGAGAGIGRQTSVRLAMAGARLVLADVDSFALAETARLCTGDPQLVSCDVSSSDEVSAMVEAACARFGRLDGAFNNAGMAQAAADTVTCDEDVFDRLMRINAKGVWLCLKHQIPAMLTGGGGSIVVNASLAGIRANPLTPAYIASKHAAVALAQGAAIEFGNRGVRVNAICPGMIHTGMAHGFLGSAGIDDAAAGQIMLPGRWGQPGEVAEAVSWLLSDASSLVNGVALPLDGGKVAA